MAQKNFCPHCGEALPNFFKIKILASAAPDKTQIEIINYLPKIKQVLAEGPTHTRDVAMALFCGNDAARRRLRALEAMGEARESRRGLWELVG